MLTAIIVAAGSSRRMGFDKLLAPLAGKPVVQHTVEAFSSAISVGEIIVVTRADRVAEFKNLLGRIAKVKDVVAGGEHRQDSVKAGLAVIKPETTFVAVHDAARPLITPAMIDQAFAAAQRHGAATLAEAVRDTLKRASEDFVVSGSVDRAQLYAMQTPQIFARDLLEQAYAKVFNDGLHVTDEVSAIEHFGSKVVLVPAEDFNFKITYDRDLKLAEAVLRERAR